MGDVVIGKFGTGKPTLQERAARVEWRAEQCQALLDELGPETEVRLTGVEMASLLQVAIRFARIVSWMQAATPRLQEAHDLLMQVLGNIPDRQEAHYEETREQLRLRAEAVRTLISKVGEL